MRNFFKLFTLAAIFINTISCKTEFNNVNINKSTLSSMTKDSSNVSISKIVSDNSEDTIYIEKYEKMIKDKKIYTNHNLLLCKGKK